jgi:hypothetical protein
MILKSFCFQISLFWVRSGLGPGQQRGRPLEPGEPVQAAGPLGKLLTLTGKLSCFVQMKFFFFGFRVK